MKALHFGAGNIGRGFIGKLLAEAQYEVIFADVNQTVIDALNTRHSYDVHVVGDGVNQFDPITNVSGIHTADVDAIITQVSTVDLITTAVGANVLEILSKTLAQALMARLKTTGKSINVIACENMVKGTTFLKEKICAHLTAQEIALLEDKVGFVDSAVDRIVPPVEASDDPLAVTVEEFCEWIVDKTQFKGEIPNIKGMTLTDNLVAFVERKLFTLNTGHASTAYLGKLSGKTTIKEAIDTPEICKRIRQIMQESGDVLIKRYGFDKAQHAAYIEKIIQRFANPYLKDDVDRVGRQPLRKLSPQDRLIKPLLGTLEYGLPHDGLVLATATALHYRNPEDEQAQELATMIEGQGVRFVLDNICKLDDERLKGAIEQAYLALI